MSILVLPWPWRKPDGPPVVPCFLPFAGCRTRCLYCAQHLQTGRPSEADPSAALDACEAMLEERLARGLPPAEAAFYGGTFTGQAEAGLALCLARAERWLASGLAACWRCSTRPDCLSRDMLRRLGDAGCRTVELGIQTFGAEPLERSLRGYGPDCARQAMGLVRQSGLVLGCQLLPGLPGSTPEGFLEDVRESCALGADFLRFYPCLVIRGTGLAKLWEQGRYRPWDMETAVETLARGLALAGAVPVARIGVAYEEELGQSVLAGPWDRDLGTRVWSRLALRTLEQAAGTGGRERRLARAWLPRRMQGFLWGQNGENRQALAAAGIVSSAVAWTAADEIRLAFDEECLP